MKTFRIPKLGNHLFEHQALCAYYFASAAHAAVKQVRKNSEEPYINHPLAVLGLLVEHCPDIVTTDVACATLLHDTVEDTGVTHQLIEQMFNSRVGEMVKRLSKATTVSFGTRQERADIEVARLAISSKEVQSIKVADLVHNYYCLAKSDEDAFRQVFYKEGAQLVETMKKADPRIVHVWHVVTMKENHDYYPCSS